MRILAFPGRSSIRAKAAVQDWSTQEIADFYRAHRLLAENGAGIGIDRGLSDEGEPWMVFFDIVSQDVFLHIARIDGTCQLICEPFNMRLDAADIPSLIAQFEHAVTDYLAIRTERAKNVVVHPAARIIMSISAVFLLFKLENGEAYAKGLTEKAVAPAPDRGPEKSATALARAQTAFQRAFDAFEPAHAAMIAGLILAGELAFSPLHAGTSSEANVESHLALSIVEHGAGPQLEQTALDQAVAAHSVPHLPQPVPVVTAAANLVVAVPALVDATEIVQFTPPDAVVYLASAKPFVEPAPAPVPPVTVAAPVQATPESIDAKPVKITEAQALEFLISAQAGSGQVAQPVQTPKTIDISMDRLGEMSKEVALFIQSHHSIVDIFALMNHFQQVAGVFDSEYRTGQGQLLYEQQGVEKLPDSAVGMITNTMSDGSTVTIVGAVSLIDDVLFFFS